MNYNLFRNGFSNAYTLCTLMNLFMTLSLKMFSRLIFFLLLLSLIVHVLISLFNLCTIIFTNIQRRSSAVIFLYFIFVSCHILKMNLSIIYISENHDIDRIDSCRKCSINSFDSFNSICSAGKEIRRIFKAAVACSSANVIAPISSYKRLI